LLTAWFAGLPLLQGLHLALAPHAHRFCQEHTLFEDVAREPLNLSMHQVSIEHRADPGQDELERDSSGWGDPHCTCAVLFAGSSRHPSLAGDSDTRIAVARATWLAGSTNTDWAVPLAILCLAPKHSPPAAAC